MANGLNLHIDVTAILKFAEDMGDNKALFERNLRTGMNEYGMLLEEGSRALAHRDGGDLESSIRVQPLELLGDTMTGSVMADSEYAWTRHETPYSERTYDKYDQGVKEEDYYRQGLGRRTRQKTAWRGQKPGRKFMARAIDLTEADWNAMAETVQNDTLRGRQT